MKTLLFRLPRRCFGLLVLKSQRLLPYNHTLPPGSPALLALLCVGVVLVAPLVARAQATATLNTIYNFGSTDGSSPVGALVRGGDGNYYGVTASGGTFSFGTVFKVTPAGVFTTLYSFSGGTDGANPAAGLALGSDGNFYGTTSGSFSLSGDPALGEGTVYQITPAGVLTTLHTFSGKDGAYPEGGLVLGSDGNFYGTTVLGGTNPDGYGTVYKITPEGVLKTLYSIGSSDEERPTGNLVQGTDGNFYGTSLGFGADYAVGAIFRITPTGAITDLYAYDGGPGYGNPHGGLVQGGDGNFYGTTPTAVFRITPAGAYTAFTDITDINGQLPSAGLVLGSDGNFYGVTTGRGTAAGGSSNPGGTVFQITSAGVLTTLYNFSGSDGASPAAPLVQSSNVTFYGTTEAGGANGDGTIFALTVVDHPAFFTGEVAVAENVYYLALPNGNVFGYYSFLEDPNYLFHFGLGYEYVFDANDGADGVYFYDFASSDFFYTSPTFPFPYLYDFNLKSVVYFYPSTNDSRPGATGQRYFYVFSTGQIISK